MRGGFIRHIPSVQSSKSLVFRGGLVHTFGSLVGFIVVTFLCVGLYILEEAFAHPLDAGAAAVITAAFIIALAAMLLIFLIQPGKGSVRRTRTASLIPQPPGSGPSRSRLPGPSAKIIYAATCRINASTLIIPVSGRKFTPTLRRGEWPESSALPE